MVKHVEIGGVSRPVKFGFAALMEFTEENGYTMADLDRLGDNMKLKDALFLVWCGLKHGARVEKQPYKYTIEDIADWLDEKPEAREQVLNVFSSSFTASEEEKK
jgi:hypothetical protein